MSSGVGASARRPRAIATRRRRQLFAALVAPMAILGALTMGAVSSGAVSTSGVSIAQLKAIVPKDVSGCTTKVGSSEKQFANSLPGLTHVIGCNVTRVDGVFFAYSFGTSAEAKKGVSAFNQAVGFDPNNGLTSKTCPPTGTLNTQGDTNWHSSNYPDLKAQVFECFVQGNQAPELVYSAPSVDSFFTVVSVSDKGQSGLRTLDTWWEKYGGLYSKP